MKFPEQRLELKHEEGGYRHYLNGEPIHAGTQLRLYLDGAWVWARYESCGGGHAALSLAPRPDVPVEVLAGERVMWLRPEMVLRWPERWER